MIPKSHEHQQAQNLYFQAGLTCQQIADMLNINRKTLFSWAKEGNWKRAKQTIRHAPSLLVEQYYDQLANLNETISNRADHPYPTKEEAATIRTLAATIKQIRTRATPGEVMDVFMDFSLEVSRSDKNAAAQIMPFLDDYVHTITDIDHLTHKKKYNWERTLDKEYQDFVAEQEKLAATAETVFNQSQEKRGDDGTIDEGTNTNNSIPIPVIARDEATKFPIPENGVTMGPPSEAPNPTEPATDATNQNNSDAKSDEKNKNGVLPSSPAEASAKEGQLNNSIPITNSQFPIPGTGKQVIRKITIAPNPVRTELIIDTRSNSPYTLSVLDPIGRVVKERKTRRSFNNIPVSDLPNGTYTLIVTDAQGHHSRHEFDIFH